MYTIINLTDMTIAVKDIMSRPQAIVKTAELRKQDPTKLFRIYYLMIEGE